MQANFFNNNRGRGASGRGGGRSFLPPRGRYTFPHNVSNERSDYDTQFNTRRSGVPLDTEVIAMRPVAPAPPRYNKVTPPQNKFDSNWGRMYFEQQQKDRFLKPDLNEKFIKDGPNLSKSASEDYDPFGDDNAYDRYATNDKVPPWKHTPPMKSSARDDINPIASRKSLSQEDDFDPMRPLWDDNSPRGGGNYNRGGNYTHDRGSSNFVENSWNQKANMSKPFGDFDKFKPRGAPDCDDWDSKEGNYRDAIKNVDFRQNQSIVKSNSFTTKDMYGEGKASGYHSDHSFKRDEAASARFSNTTERGLNLEENKPGFRDQREFVNPGFNKNDRDDGESRPFNREERFNRNDPLQDRFHRIEPQVDLLKRNEGPLDTFHRNEAPLDTIHRNKHHLGTINRDEPQQSRFNKFEPQPDRFNTRESELVRFDRNRNEPQPDILNRNEPQQYGLNRTDSQSNRFVRYDEPASDSFNRSGSPDRFNTNNRNGRFNQSSPEQDRFERNYDKKRDFSSAFNREDPWEDEENFSRNKHDSFNKDREFGFERGNKNEFPRERFGGDVIDESFQSQNLQEESFPRGRFQSRNQEERFPSRNNERERFQNKSRERDNEQERFPNKSREKNSRQERFENKSQERYNRQGRFRSRSRERNNQQQRNQNRSQERFQGRNRDEERFAENRFSGNSRSQERFHSRNDRDSDTFDRNADHPPSKRFKKWYAPKQHEVKFSPPRRRSPEPHEPKFSPPNFSPKKPQSQRKFHPNLQRMTNKLNVKTLPQPNKTIGWNNKKLQLNLPRGQWPLRVQKAKMYMQQCYNPRLIPPNPTIATMVKDLFQRIKINPQGENISKLLITHAEFPNKSLSLAQKEEIKNIVTKALDTPSGHQIRSLVKRPVGLLIKPKTDSCMEQIKKFINDFKFEVPLKIIDASEEEKSKRLVVQLPEDLDGEEALKVIEAENDLKTVMWGYSFKVATEKGADFYYDVPSSIFKFLMGSNGKKQLKYKGEWVSVLFPSIHSKPKNKP